MKGRCGWCRVSKGEWTVEWTGRVLWSEWVARCARVMAVRSSWCTHVRVAWCVMVVTVAVRVTSVCEGCTVHVMGFAGCMVIVCTYGGMVVG